MTHDSRVLMFDGSDYAHWKTHMRAYLKGKCAEIWAIVIATSYPTTSAVQSHHDANNKAVDILLLSLSHTELDRVCDLDVAHKIWSRL
jgi:NAD-dependent SIR2 family protein deacetylase